MPNQKTQKSQKKQASPQKEANGPTNPEEQNQSSPPQKQNQQRQPPVGRIIADIFKSIAIEETQVSIFKIMTLTFKRID